MNDISGIYCIENIINNKKYIGQSIHIKDRWTKHIAELNNGTHHNDYLQKAWNKYGEENFSFYILEECSINLLDEKEICYINKYDSMNRSYGYNLTSGGQLRKNSISKETRDKISHAVKNSYVNSELKEIRRLQRLEYWANPKNKEKIIGQNNVMYGIHHTDESKRKMSEHKKGIRSWRRNVTPVLCIESNQIYNDATDAGKILNLDSSTILKVCQGKRKTCGGYHWEFC